MDKEKVSIMENIYNFLYNSDLNSTRELYKNIRDDISSFDVGPDYIKVIDKNFGKKDFIKNSKIVFDAINK